jgi:hypothetical protein
MQSITDMSKKEVSSPFVYWIPIRVQAGNIEHIPNISSHLQADISERYDGELVMTVQKLPESVAKDSMLQFLKFTVYLSSNMQQDSHADDFLQWIINNEQLRILESLVLTEEIPAIGAFAESIFWSALGLNTSYVVQILLRVGIDPSTLEKTGQCTPLQVVSRAGNIELVQTLLDAGADVTTLTRES